MFAAPLVEALEDERRRVGHEVDYSIRQTLALLRLALQRPEGAGGQVPADLVAQAAVAARAIQRHLLPPELDDLGLAAAIGSYCDELRPSGLTVRLRHALPDGFRASREVELVAYRAVQWMLDNVARHAGVERATVDLSLENGHLRLVIADEGRGFRPDGIRTVGGLTQLEGRARIVGGTVTIESAEGSGTRVIVVLPANPRTASRRSDASPTTERGGGRQ